MTVNIYDSANQIEREIRQMPEFLALKEAFQLMKEDSEAADLFQEFQQFQGSLQQKQAEGQEFTEEDADHAQKMTEKIQASPLITDLMNKEQALSMIVNDLNKVIMKPIQELYGE